MGYFEGISLRIIILLLLFMLLNAPPPLLMTESLRYVGHMLSGPGGGADHASSSTTVLDSVWRVSRQEQSTATDRKRKFTFTFFSSLNFSHQRHQKQWQKFKSCSNITYNLEKVFTVKFISVHCSIFTVCVLFSEDF